MKSGKGVVGIELESVLEIGEGAGAVALAEFGMGGVAPGDGIEGVEAGEGLGGGDGAGVFAALVEPGGELAPGPIDVGVIGEDGAHLADGLGEVALLGDDVGAGGAELGGGWIAQGRRPATVQGFRVAASKGERGGAQTPSLHEPGVAGNRLVQGRQPLIALVGTIEHPGLEPPGTGFAGALAGELLGQLEPEAGLAELPAPGIELAPGPIVAGLDPNGIADAVERGGGLAKLPKDMGKGAVVEGILGGTLDGLLEDLAGIGEAAGILASLSELAHAGTPGRIELADALEGIDLGGVIEAGPVDEGQIDPGAGQKREPLGHLAGEQQRFRESVHGDQMPGEGGPGMPEIGPLDVGLAQELKEVVGREEWAGQLGELEDAVAEGGLADQLGLDEIDGLAAVGGGGAGLDEAMHREAVVDRDLEGGSELRAGFGEASLAQEAIAANIEEGGMERLEGGGRIELAIGLVETLEALQGGGELAAGPGIIRVLFDEGASDDLEVRGAAVADPLDAELEERQVMGELAGGLGEMIEGGRPALGLGEEEGGGAMGIDGEGLGGEDLTPELELGAGIAPASGEGGRGARPFAGRGPGAGVSEEGFGPFEVVAGGELLSGEKAERSILGPDGEGLIEDGKGGNGLIDFEESADKGARREGGLARVLLETAGEEIDGLGGSFEPAAGVEPGGGEGFLLVVEAGGKPVIIAGVVEAALLPENMPADEAGRGIGRAAALGAVEPAESGGVLASVLAKLPRELLPKQRIGIAPDTDIAEPGEDVLTAPHVAKDAGSGQEKIDIAGVEVEEVLDGPEDLGGIRVVMGEGAASLAGDAMERIDGFELLARRDSGRAVMAVEGEQQGMVAVVEIGIGQLNALEAGGLIGGNDRQAARAVSGLRRKPGLGQKLDIVAKEGIPDDEALAEVIKADDSLLVGVAGLDGGEGERDAAADEVAGGGGGDGELARDPAVSLRPIPFAVGGRAVVADGVGDIEVGDRLVPEAAQRGEGGGDAGEMMLADERDRELDALGFGGRRLEPGGELDPGWGGAGTAGLERGGLELAEPIEACGPASGEPLLKRGLGQRRQPLGIFERRQGILEKVELELEGVQVLSQVECGEGHPSRPQKLQRFPVASNERQGVSRLGGKDPVARVAGEGGLGNLQGLGIAVLGFEPLAPLERDPGGLMAGVLGLSETVVGQLEIAEAGGNPGAQQKEIGTVGRIRGRRLGEELEPLPCRNGAAQLQDGPDHEIMGLPAAGLAPPGAEEKPHAEGGRAKVPRKPSGENQIGRLSPGAEGAERPGTLVGFEEASLIVERLEGRALGVGECDWRWWRIGQGSHGSPRRVISREGRAGLAGCR